MYIHVHVTTVNQMFLQSFNFHEFWERINNAKIRINMRNSKNYILYVMSIIFARQNLRMLNSGGSSNH